MTVDDSKSMRQMVKATLESGGYQVLEAEDGQQALDALSQQQVDAVIADVNMPVMDGITLIGRLRALPQYRLTPLLMLTTESSAERKQEGRRAGATGWIVKPFDPDKLLTALARVV